MIVYFIQAHNDFVSLEWLFRSIYDEQNQHILSIDGDEAFVERTRQLMGSHKNVHVYRSSPVVWGGSTIVTAILSGLAYANTLDGWDYFINLSGHDAPFQSQRHIRERLQAEGKLGRRNFIQYFGRSWVKWLESLPENDAAADVVSSKMFRCIRAAPPLIAALEDRNTSAIMRWFLRPNYYVEENIFSRTIFCRYVTENEKKIRKEILSGNQSFRAGRQWFIFSRPMCEWISRAPATWQMLEYFRNILISDESFFQTLLTQAPLSIAETIFPDNLRLRGGMPLWLADDAILEVQNTDALFGRKLIWSQSHRLRRLIEQRVGLSNSDITIPT